MKSIIDMTNLKKQIRTGAALSVSLAMLAAMTVYAQPQVNSPGMGAPEENPVMHEGTNLEEATWQKLNDNVLEYEEIESRIRYFNPTIVNLHKTIDDTVADLVEEKDDLDDTVKDLEEQLKAAIAASENPATDPLVIGLKAGLAQAKAGRDIYKKTIKSLTSADRKTQIQLDSAGRQLSRGVQSLVIGYKTLLSQKAMLEKMAELYQETYNCYLAMAGVGMASQMDVTGAQLDLMNVQSSLSSISGTEIQLYNQIKILCGWKVTDMPVIGDVPAADLSRMAGYNPEIDYIYAAGNNSGVNAVRNSGIKNSTIREAGEAQATSLVRAKLVTAYSDIGAAGQAYNAAVSGFESAKVTKKAADLQYQLGMMSKAQYLGAQLMYVQKEAALKTADLALTQAMNAYEGAVDGSIVIQ